jgi:probable O-glycosylation ligase (exosortase A-associated)
LIRVIGLSLGFYGLKGGIFALASGGGMMVFGPQDSFLYANNSIGLALAMNIPILQYLIKQEPSARLRWLIKAMLLFSYPAIVCTYSRGAWIGMVAATALSVIKSRNKFLMIGVTGIVTMVLVTVVPKIAPENLVHRYDDLVNYDQEVSAQSRFWNWEFCKRVGLARPLVGGGFNFYAIETYEKFYPEFLARWPGKVWSCHSMWLTVLGEQGIPGTVIWVSLIVSCMISLTQMRLKARGSPDEKYMVDFADMIKSSMVTYFVVGTFLDAAYFDLFYYFVAFVVVQKGIIANAAKSTHRLVAPLGVGLVGQTRNQQRAPNYS